MTFFRSDVIGDFFILCEMSEDTAPAAFADISKGRHPDW